MLARHPAHHVAAAHNHPATIFAAASVDAFGNYGRKIQVPKSPQTLTWPVWAKTSFTLYSGTWNQAILAVHPSAANNRAQVTYSSAATFSSPVNTNWRPTTVALTGVAGAYCSTLPYDAATLDLDAGQDSSSDHISYRIAVAGIRIRFLGKMTDRAGILYCTMAPGHADTTHYTPDEILQNPKTIKFDFSHPENNIFEHTFSASMEHELELNTFSTNASFPFRDRLNATCNYWDPGIGSKVSGPAVGFIYIQCPSAGVTFDVEYIIAVEYAGKSLTNFSSETVTDDNALNNAISAASASKSAMARAPHDPPGAHGAVAAETTAGALLTTGSAAVMAENPVAGMALEGVGALLSNPSTDRALNKAFNRGTRNPPSTIKKTTKKR